MTTIRLALAGMVVLCLGRAATAQQMLATDRVSAQMLGTDRAELPIHEERLTVAIDGEYARSTLLQTYTNASNAQIEGHYELRPGQGTHVDGFAYWNGEERIVGEVFERDTANRVYNEVTARKRDPGLLEQVGEGVFAFKVFPIAPHEDKRVEVRWSRWLDRRAQTVHFRAPVTSGSAEIVVTIDGRIKNVRSTTHQLHIEPLATGVRLRADHPGRAGELELSWDVDEPPWTPDVYVAPSTDKGGEGWFAVSLAAPTLPATAATPKDLTIVIDHSGSMQTDQKMLYAKRAAAALVGLLDANDRVNVIGFSDEVDPLFHAPHAVDKDTRDQALGFIDRLFAGGGTDLALALATAMQTQDPAATGRPHIVVFLTDGVSDAAQAVAVKTGDIRLFTLGVGTDVNKPLLGKLAAEKRGRFVYIEQARDIEPEVARLGQAIAHPLLVDVSVSIEGLEATRIYPRTLPDLFAEDELRISGRYHGQGPARVVIRGKLEGRPVEYSRAIDLAHAHPWTAPLWAQARIDHLLEQIELAGPQHAAAELETEVIDLALAYNFVTPYTAFLAVPERELGPGSAQTLADARARKRELVAHEGQAANGTTIVATTSPSRANVADVFGPDSVEVHVRMNKDVAEADEDAPVTEATASHRHGCAGCATSSGDGASLLALVGIVALVVLRRRAARSR